MLNHCSTQKIETNNLILRMFKLSDNDDMLKYWISDKNVQFMYSEPVYTTKDEVNKLLNNYISSYKNKDYYRWAITEKKSNSCIGQIAFFLVDSKNHFAEIEYCIGAKFQRRGYATQATKAIINFGFNQINLNKIQICHKENNIPSRGVIEKCGFTYEGTLRDYFYMDGKYVSRLYYSMLKSEWKDKHNSD